MTTFNWQIAAPEILLLVAACAIALVDLFVRDEQRRPTFWLTQIAIAVFALMHASMLGDSLAVPSSAATEYGFDRLFVADPMGHLLALAAAIALMVTLVYAQVYIHSRELGKGELYALSLFALMGVAVMISANNFLVIYVGLEVMSLSLYALVALRRDHAISTEAAMKYFVLGALASGFLLYGMSLLYGATGSLSLQGVYAGIQAGQNSQVLGFGAVFIVSGLAFKLGVVPFHMWVPDVYQGAPTAITLMIGGFPKLAAFAIAIRILVDGLVGIAMDWQQMLMILAVASMLLGNLAAIAQTNLKRMLAYSGIAQLGFMLLGFTPTVVYQNTINAANGFSSAMFYVITYVMTTLGTFGLLMLLTRDGFESEEVADLSGLAKRSPWMAAMMTLFMFSLAGVPPMVGFYAKFAVLQALISTHQATYVTLAVVAVLLSLIGAFYYLRIVKVMYFDEPKDQSAPEHSGGVGLVLAVNGAAILVLGVMPNGLMVLCRDTIVRALAG